MATWHQEQARKRPGFKLYHDTKWSVLSDPPGQMASSMLFATYTQAQAYLAKVPPEYRAHCVILRPAKLTWLEVDESRYDEMLNIMPPLLWQIHRGFLVSEAWDHDFEGRSRYPAFVRLRGRYYEATLPMTVQEFTELDVNTIPT
jgi:hypothetical protein